ncbi:MAG: hypothetical protein ACOX02_04180 [Acholeplasmatales bacterium]
MKVKNVIYPLIFSLIVAILLFVLKQYTASFIAASFSFVMLVSLVGLIIINKKEEKRKDKRFGIYTKENLIIEFNKLKKQKDENKLKALMLLYIVPNKEYEDEKIKALASYLNKKFSIDPIGYDEGISIVLGNIHELLVNELMKQIKEELVENNINIDYKYGFSYYTNNETYENLLEEIKRGLNNNVKSRK